MIVTSQPHRELITYIARRFSKLAGIALCAILVKATYNAWIQLGSFPALWQTSYGQMIIVKILLLSMLIVLGSSNRFISIPFLHNPFFT
ncbi:MAG: CopD family protein [Thermodesulfobacteriota bacterium]